ncbi:MAG: NUDIX domain-containing protein [Opitutaceae bacterium]|jgi:8-oxo-dGTP diphosphatase
MHQASLSPLSYKLAVLVFIENPEGQHLLILRNRQPNRGNWSPIGGKLETAIGESPFECAARETREETGHDVSPEDFHLFAMIAEKAYEGESHWLLFLFRCLKPIRNLPADIDEGRFSFFSHDEIERLPIPETDRQALWPIWDKYRDRFVAMRINCSPEQRLQIDIEQLSPPTGKPTAG